MAHQQRNQKTRPELASLETVRDSQGVVAKLPPDGSAEVLPKSDPPAPSGLTADEQMALYEQDLKENDWGHQPC